MGALERKEKEEEEKSSAAYLILFFFFRRLSGALRNRDALHVTSPSYTRSSTGP